MPRKRIYLVDGTALCYRSFFALKLSTSKGLPTGAVYGVYQTLKKIISKYNPDYMGVCFDVSRKTFRTERFKAYKIQRPPLPDALGAQIPLVKKLISCLGVKAVEKEGFEADDVIASLCQTARKNDLAVVIVSSDKDLFQLIDNDAVVVYNYHKDKFIDRDNFREENGFGASAIIDFLSLAGDSTDNIPGARGIGKVGAAKLIKEFGNIENIFDNLDKIPKKTQEILIKSKKDVLLSKELVELYPCDLELSLKDFKIKGPDFERLRKLFSELEFRGLIKEFPSAPLSLDVTVREGVSKSRLEKLAKDFLFYFVDKDRTFIFDPEKNCVYKVEVSEIKEILTDPEIKKISYGLKSQLALLAGINMKNLWFDIKIAAYLIDSSLPDYSLPTIASRYLGLGLTEIPPDLSPYFIYRLYEPLRKGLEKAKLDELFFEVEMPLIAVLRRMQDDGVKIDKKILHDLLKKVNKRISEARAEVFSICDKEFNLNSPKQLSAILFDQLKIKPIKKTKTGFSTNEEVLEKLAFNHPIAKFILEYRHLNKLKTTYIVPLIEEVTQNRGMLHTQFHQTSTQTGRLSSSSPNLQSIPQKGEFSFWLRKAFVPTFKGGYILSGDYSQIELRILAHLSGDENLVKAFEQNLDIHNFTAGLLFGVSTSEVDSAQRDIAKRVNFSIAYGMSAFGLSKELKITPPEAQNFIDDYFNRYSKVRKYIDDICAKVEKEGVVKTILKRPRHLPDINSANVSLREFARRQAINAPIQGSCADLIKIAMVRIYSQLQEKALKTKLIIQIHDELIFDVPPEELEPVKALIQKSMEGALQLNVPVKVNIKYGRNWGEACRS